MMLMTMRVPMSITRSLSRAQPSGRRLYHGPVLEREVAGGQLPPVVWGERRVVLLALRELGPGTPRMEPTAGGRVDRRGHVPLQDDPPLPGRQVRVGDGDRRQQRPGVRMLGVQVQGVS